MIKFNEATYRLNKPDPLYTAVVRQSYYLGAPIDELGRLCEWIVDSPPDDDDSDHWQNIRPY